MAYRIEFTAVAEQQLQQLTSYNQNRVLDEIDKQLRHEPARQTRRRKPLEAFAPEWWELGLPVWQLRVGEYRVLYSPDGSEQVVTVAAVLYKGRLTTAEMIDDEH